MPKERPRMRPSFLVTVFSVLLLIISDSTAHGQANQKKAEVGALFSFLRQSHGAVLGSSGGAVGAGISPLIAVQEANKPGFGGRITYNLLKSLAVEAEGTFFPTQGAFNGGGRRAVGVFGAKAGTRRDQIGIFGKLRPGFLYRESCLGPGPGIGGSLRCGSETNCALDFGIVLEYYPSSRTILRVDMGDIMVFHWDEIGSHGFQMSVGVGLRF